MMNSNDDIPVAQRHSSQNAVWQQPSQKRSWGWVLFSFLCGALLLVPALLSLRPQQDPSQSLSSASVESSQTTAQEIVAASPVPTSSPLTVLGHFAHGEAPREDLLSVATYHGRPVELRRPAAQKYLEMAAAAKAAGVHLVAVSGFRSVADQEYLFFQRAQAAALRPQERALVSAPPGYSEHHTGYAVDVGDTTAPATLLQESFEETPAFRWLQSNAARFGFELSFPRYNDQGVSYEPWHWRFVGDRHSLETFYTKDIVGSRP